MAVLRFGDFCAVLTQIPNCPAAGFFDFWAGWNIELILEAVWRFGGLARGGSQVLKERPDLVPLHVEVTKAISAAFATLLAAQTTQWSSLRWGMCIRGVAATAGSSVSGIRDRGGDQER